MWPSSNLPSALEEFSVESLSCLWEVLTASFCPWCRLYHLQTAAQGWRSTRGGRFHPTVGDKGKSCWFWGGAVCWNSQRRPQGERPVYGNAFICSFHRDKRWSLEGCCSAVGFISARLAEQKQFDHQYWRTEKAEAEYQTQRCSMIRSPPLHYTFIYAFLASPWLRLWPWTLTLLRRPLALQQHAEKNFSAWQESSLCGRWRWECVFLGAVLLQAVNSWGVKEKMYLLRDWGRERGSHEDRDVPSG